MLGGSAAALVSQASSAMLGKPSCHGQAMHVPGPVVKARPVVLFFSNGEGAHLRKAPAEKRRDAIRSVRGQRFASQCGGYADCGACAALVQGKCR